jgi:hypothetical protein
MDIELRTDDAPLLCIVAVVFRFASFYSVEM